ncbi:MAG: amino acid adenylation domain-containing protein, partial [Myxococcota bacterium]
MSAPLNVEASPLSPVQRARLRWCAPSGADVLVRLRLYAFGALDRPRLERAFEALRARHELLAMRVARLPEVEQPVQFVAAESEAVDAGLGATMSVSTFATGPGETAHRIEIALPWLLSDGPTLEILASELVEHYADAPEAPGALQFLDVAAWQEDLFESDEAAEARRFWSEVTPAQRRAPFPEGALEETGAPAACGPAITLSRTLEPGRVAALTAWADAHGLTPDACLHAAFSALLFRRAGTPVPVALRIEGRDAPELAGAAGALDRWVPVPTAPPEAPGGERLSEHALRLAQAEHEVRRWTDAFDGTGRDGERLGPYAAAFGAGPEPRGVIASPVTAGGVRFAFAGVDDGPLPAPLVLEASLEPASHPHSIVLTWRALHGSREAAELDALADQYAQLLASALSDDPPLESLVLSDTATALATIQVSALSPSRPVADRFAEQVALDPTAIALLDEAGAVSREELDRAANRIAAALQGAGVSPGDRVGVALPRSGAVIAGFLGIWRVGAAFVPLDPELPSRALRARADAGDLRVVLVASDAADASRRSLPEEVTLVAVDPAAELPRDLSAPKAPTPAKELAYGIFTSGSTGTPKLVGIEHGALASYVGAVESRLGGEPGWSYATVSSFASDLGHTTIFTALASGGTLHVVGSERAMDPDRIAERFRAAPVDVLKIVPSHLAALLSGRDPAGVLPRRVLVLGGERLEPGLVDRVRALAPELRILNHYGPTETTVGVLTHEVAPTRTDASAPPLGAPLPGVTVEVVDGAGRVVPRGVPGELWIGGGQLARGYLGDEDQTAARFVEADRTIQGDGATRRYRTGDRAWMDALGRVHFGGRIDAQLKIRGIRIEPGEIERTLMAHPTVSDAAVRAFDGRLVGYLTGAGVEPDEVSRWL